MALKMIRRKAVGQFKTIREELVNDLRAVGTTVAKDTTGNIICRNGLKFCRSPYSSLG